MDDNWVCDETLPKTDNDRGTQNNVIVVDKADFHVFDALDRFVINVFAPLLFAPLVTHNLLKQAKRLRPRRNHATGTPATQRAGRRIHAI